MEGDMRLPMLGLFVGFGGREILYFVWLPVFSVQRILGM